MAPNYQPTAPAVPLPLQLRFSLVTDYDADTGQIAASVAICWSADPDELFHHNRPSTHPLNL